MRREFSSGKRLRFNKRGEWVSPLFDNVSSLSFSRPISLAEAQAWKEAMDRTGRGAPPAVRL